MEETYQVLRSDAEFSEVQFANRLIASGCTFTSGKQRVLRLHQSEDPARVLRIAREANKNPKVLLAETMDELERLYHQATLPSSSSHQTSFIPSAPPPEPSDVETKTFAYNKKELVIEDAKVILPKMPVVDKRYEIPLPNMGIIITSTPKSINASYAKPRRSIPGLKLNPDPQSGFRV